MGLGVNILVNVCFIEYNYYFCITVIHLKPATMKAIIVKNNNFETIGFEVTGSGSTLFRWGISPQLKSNFQKEIDVNDWMPQIFELVRIETRISEENSFISRWFEVATKQKLVKENQKVNFAGHDQKIKDLNELIENIIKNII